MLISTDVPALVAIVPRIACLMTCHRQRAIRHPLKIPTRLFRSAEPGEQESGGYFKSDLTIAQQLSVADQERPDQSLANSTANVGSC